MNLEMITSIASAVVIAAGLALRLNTLKASKDALTSLQVTEVVGGSIALAGCACITGEWFLPALDVHGETILLFGLACFTVGVSGGRLCQFTARLQGWDGKTDRREREVEQEPPQETTLERRFTRVR